MYYIFYTLNGKAFFCIAEEIDAALKKAESLKRRGAIIESISRDNKA